MCTNLNQDQQIQWDQTHRRQSYLKHEIKTWEVTLGPARMLPNFSFIVFNWKESNYISRDLWVSQLFASAADTKHLLSLHSSLILGLKTETTDPEQFGCLLSPQTKDYFHKISCFFSYLIVLKTATAVRSNNWEEDQCMWRNLDLTQTLGLDRRQRSDYSLWKRLVNLKR